MISFQQKQILVPALTSFIMFLKENNTRKVYDLVEI